MLLIYFYVHLSRISPYSRSRQWVIHSFSHGVSSTFGSLKLQLLFLQLLFLLCGHCCLCLPDLLLLALSSFVSLAPLLPLTAIPVASPLLLDGHWIFPVALLSVFSGFGFLHGPVIIIIRLSVALVPLVLQPQLLLAPLLLSGNLLRLLYKSNQEITSSERLFIGSNVANQGSGQHRKMPSSWLTKLTQQHANLIRKERVPWCQRASYRIVFMRSIILSLCTGLESC